jgi:hypothetical protein
MIDNKVVNGFVPDADTVADRAEKCIAYLRDLQLRGREDVDSLSSLGEAFVSELLAFNFDAFRASFVVRNRDIVLVLKPYQQ